MFSVFSSKIVNIELVFEYNKILRIHPSVKEKYLNYLIVLRYTSYAQNIRKFQKILPLKKQSKLQFKRVIVIF